MVIIFFLHILIVNEAPHKFVFYRMQLLVIAFKSKNNNNLLSSMRIKEKMDRHSLPLSYPTCKVDHTTFLFYKNVLFYEMFIPEYNDVQYYMLILFINCFKKLSY